MKILCSEKGTDNALSPLPVKEWTLQHARYSNFRLLLLWACSTSSPKEQLTPGGKKSCLERPEGWEMSLWCWDGFYCQSLSQQGHSWEAAWVCGCYSTGKIVCASSLMLPWKEWFCCCLEGNQKAARSKGNVSSHSVLWTGEMFQCGFFSLCEMKKISKWESASNAKYLCFIQGKMKKLLSCLFSSLHYSPALKPQIPFRLFVNL